MTWEGSHKVIQSKLSTVHKETEGTEGLIPATRLGQVWDSSLLTPGLGGPRVLWPGLGPWGSVRHGPLAKLQSWGMTSDLGEEQPLSTPAASRRRGCLMGGHGGVCGRPRGGKQRWLRSGHMLRDGCVCVCVHAQSCTTLCDPMDRSPPGSSVREILQAGILGWVSISSSRGSSRRGVEPVSLLSPALAAGFFTTAPPGEHWASSRPGQHKTTGPGGLSSSPDPATYEPALPR